MMLWVTILKSVEMCNWLCHHGLVVMPHFGSMGDTASGLAAESSMTARRRKCLPVGGALSGGGFGLSAQLKELISGDVAPSSEDTEDRADGRLPRKT